MRLDRTRLNRNAAEEALAAQQMRAVPARVIGMREWRALQVLTAEET